MTTTAQLADPGLACALPQDGRFDYIIIGGGTGGCALAARLSEDPAVSVCLLEAGGGDANWRVRTPGAVGFAHTAPDLGWGYRSVPQAGLQDRQINLARGRLLGGTSAVNGMVYFRGPATDFDTWHRLGNPGWSYEEVLPYFLRSEGNFDWPESRLHHCGGPVGISSLQSLNPLVPRFLLAADSLGYPRCSDFNTPAAEGFGTRQLTIRDGRRETAATAFLDPIRGRGNLAVLTGALVHRVRFDGRRATGVDLELAGNTVRQLHCQREVILCAGAYNTPQILLRSGLGPAEPLRELGIDVIADLPQVGKNLRDHVSAFVQARSSTTFSYGVSWRTMPRLLKNLAEYALWRRGPLASNLFEAAGFVRSHDDLRGPNLHIVLNPFLRPRAGGIVPFGHGVAIMATVLQPHSHGTVSLRSAEPQASPLIDPGFLRDSRDVDTLVEGVKIARRLLQAPAFADIRPREVDPGPDVRSDDEWADYVRRTAYSVFHPGGTCRMGSDPQSVVDPSLRVRHVSGLRIADASIYPTLISGNTNASVMMIAEKAADLIRGKPQPSPITLPGDKP